MCFFLFLNASSERGSKRGVRRSLLSQHSPTLCYLKSVSSICIFRTSSEVSTRKIWMAFLFWIFCANKFENHVGGSFLIGNSSCYSRDLFPNANTGVDRLFSSWSSVFRLIICFKFGHLFSSWSSVFKCKHWSWLFCIWSEDYGGQVFQVSHSNTFQFAKN